MSRTHVGRVGLFLLLLAGVTPCAAAGQSTSDSERRAAMQARRDSLEDEVRQKFVARLSDELKLDDVRRLQVDRALKESSDRRHTLLRQSAQLRGRMYRALRTGTTSDADFARLLTESQELRAREHAVWEDDMLVLSRILTPRQQVYFILSWARFQENLRDILSRQMREGDKRSERH